MLEMTTRTQTIRTYSELIRLPTFRERFEYLKISGCVGKETFGHYRYLNQRFYQTSTEWKSIKRFVIARDLGCDLGVEGFEIHGLIYVHHMNPITPEDIEKFSDNLVNPEFLISTSFDTHNAIHYGDASLLITEPVERKPNDTCPWKRGADQNGQHSNLDQEAARNRRRLRAL